MMIFFSILIFISYSILMNDVWKAQDMTTLSKVCVCLIIATTGIEIISEIVKRFGV